jgi:predicted NAD/FAD-dependent oxidoreductase
LEAGPEAVAAALTAAFTALTGLPVLAARAHRWRYALASQPLGAPFMWDAAQLLGLCGDWCLAGRLEAAFLSGQGLGIRILHDQ